jgi:hypothetical protein
MFKIFLFVGVVLALLKILGVLTPMPWWVVFGVGFAPFIITLLFIMLIVIIGMIAEFYVK